MSSTMSKRGRTLVLSSAVSDWFTSGRSTVTRGVGAFDTDISLSFRLHLRVGEPSQRSRHGRFAARSSKRARGSKSTIHVQARWSPRFHRPSARTIFGSTQSRDRFRRIWWTYHDLLGRSSETGDPYPIGQFQFRNLAPEFRSSPRPDSFGAEQIV